MRARSCISPARSAPEAGTLEALPCGALFLCLAELLGEPASGLADKGFVSIPVADKRPRAATTLLCDGLDLAEEVNGSA